MAYSFILEENFHIPNAGGGGSFFFPFAENDTIATEKPTALQEEDEEFQDSEKFLTIVRYSKQVVSGNNNEPNFVHIDSTVGINTIFRFIWEDRLATAVVRMPNGTIIAVPSQPEERQVEIRIPGTAEMNFTEDQRVVIYGEVTQGELPVIRANVKALIKRPDDGEASAYFAVELFDHGTGADTAKDDGIYSAYFMGFSCDGVYKVTLEVENEAVGQAKKITFPRHFSGVMPQNWNRTTEPVMVDVDPFMRATQAVEFTVVSAPTMDNMNEVDIFPPARVTDLRIEGVSRYQGSLMLKWTAPGDDYDIGKAALYDLRCSHSFEEISNFHNARQVNDSDIISGDLSSPRQSGSEETLSIRIPTMVSAKPDLMLFLAFRIRAIDDTGLTGETSNVATVVVDYGAGPTTATPPPSSRPVLSTVATLPPAQNDTPTTTACATTTVPNNYWEVLGRNMAIVLGVSVFLVIFATVVLCFACRTRRRTHKEGQAVTYFNARQTRRVSDAWVLEEV